MSYVIWSFEHMMWWGPGRCGYTERLDDAGRYTAAEAGLIAAESLMLEEVAVPLHVAESLGAPTCRPYGKTVDELLNSSLSKAGPEPPVGGTRVN